MEHRNALGQPIGFPLPGWKPPPAPARETLSGRYCRVEPLDPARHAAQLYEQYAVDRDGALWTYMAHGPFASAEAYRVWADKACTLDDPLQLAIVDLADDQAIGVATFMRIQPAAGSIEVGGITYSPRLQRNRIATEAMYLMMRRAFELGYRRYEWKCDTLNAPSRKAAQRLGFSYEGEFRQAIVYKQRNRDTAWYSIIDSEWPALRGAFEAWLDPANFAEGRQRKSLSELTRALVKRWG